MTTAVMTIKSVIADNYGQTFFSTQFVDVSKNEFHFSRRTWIYFAFTVPLTLLTMIVWIIGMKAEVMTRWLSRRLRKQSRNDNDEATDLELAM